MLRRAAVLKRICDRRRAQNADTQSKCPQTPKGPARYNHHDGTCKTFHQTLQAQVPWGTGSHTERSEETVCFLPHHEPDSCDLPGGRKTFRSFIRWTDCQASAGGKTTGGCFLCVPETEFRQGIKKRQNKGSIYLCPEPGTVSACVSKANQLKPYEYFSRYLGSTVYIQKTTKKPTKRPYQIDFTQFSKTFLLVSHILPDNHKIPNK